MNRRRYLAAIGTTTGAALAGCGGIFETRQVGTAPLVENRPDAVYIPSHIEGMQMIDMAMAGRLRIALSYSYPHRFWLVNGDRTNMVEIGDDQSAHLMISVWDGETATAIPSSTVQSTITRGGESVDQRSMWPMLSQNMGFHYGDNVPLEGDGTYDVSIQFGPVGTRRTGAFRDAFGEQASVEYSWEYSESQKQEIMYSLLDERKGERDAIDPMQMEMMPVPQLPPAGEYPGSTLGEGKSGDATFVTTLLDERPAGIDGTGPYLAVSPRTPYNRYPIPFMALSATLSRDGSSVYDGTLTPTLDPNLKYHYGVSVDSVEPGDRLTITPETPPQVARHEGYETAFLSMDSVEMTIESTE
jgi:hypothetical protein